MSEAVLGTVSNWEMRHKKNCSPITHFEWMCCPFGWHRLTLNTSCTPHMVGQEHKIFPICTDIQCCECENMALQFPDLRKQHEKHLVKSEFLLRAQKVQYWFFSSTVIPINSVNPSSRITWATLCAPETVQQSVAVLSVCPIVAFLTLPSLSGSGAGRCHTCT